MRMRMRLQLLGDSEARDGDLYRYHTVEQSTLRGRNSSAPTPNVWLRSLAPSVMAYC